MNIRDDFPGHGMQTGFAAAQDAQRVEARNDAFGYGSAATENESNANAVSEALFQPTANTDRGIFERSIAVRRQEKAKQLQIASAAMSKAPRYSSPTTDG